MKDKNVSCTSTWTTSRPHLCDQDEGYSSMLRIPAGGLELKTRIFVQVKASNLTNRYHTHVHTYTHTDCQSLFALIPFLDLSNKPAQSESLHLFLKGSTCSWTDATPPSLLSPSTPRPTICLWGESSARSDEMWNNMMGSLLGISSIIGSTLWAVRKLMPETHCFKYNAWPKKSHHLELTEQIGTSLLLDHYCMGDSFSWKQVI